MSLYDGIIAKNNDNESDSQQVPHESKRPLSLYGDLLPSSAVIEQEPVTYKPQDKIANVSNC